MLRYRLVRALDCRIYDMSIFRRHEFGLKYYNTLPLFSTTRGLISLLQLLHSTFQAVLISNTFLGDRRLMLSDRCLSVCPWYGGRPCPRPQCVRWGPSSPLKGAQQLLTFRPMFIVAKRSPISATAGHLLCCSSTSVEVQKHFWCLFLIRNLSF